MTKISGRHNRIRGVVIFFTIFLSVVLYQNPNGMIGRYTALLGLSLALVLSISDKISSKKRVLFDWDTFMLLLFLGVSLITTLLKDVSLEAIGVFIAQVILCLVLFNTDISETEYKFIKYLYILSMVFCSIMVIRSCMNSTRFYHGDIELFGASLDPNYIGVPIVFASVLTLGEVLIEKKFRIVGLIAFFIFFVAILYTASRGNSVAFALGNGLVLYSFITKSRVSVAFKVLIIVAIAALFVLVLHGGLLNLSESAERMTSFGEGADNGRFEIWKRSYDTWKQSPFWGIGLDGSIRMYGQGNHNSYVQVLLETGVIGLALMIVFLKRVLVKSFHYNKVFFYALCGLLLQVAFIDTLTNRCLWPYLCWAVMLPHTHQLRGRFNLKSIN